MGHAKTRSAPRRTSDPAQTSVWSETVGGPPGRPASADPARDLLEKNLIRLALELARAAGPHGLTVCDIRIHAELRGFLSGDEQGRTLSWLGHIPRKAGLKSTGQVRPSTRPKAHGNFQRTWILPEFAA